MIRLQNIKLDIIHNEKDIFSKVKKNLNIKSEEIIFMEISKCSIDARKKNEIKYIYSVDLDVKKSVLKKCLKNKNVTTIETFKYTLPKVKSDIRPIIVGSGPSGLFCALALCEAGLRPIIIEQGKDVDKRKKDIDEFMKTSVLNVSSNIQFGEGGAGTFSDGKLTTGIKDKRKDKIIDELIKAGAPKEIKYLAKPHVGTDNLINVVKNLRNKIIKFGGEFYFETKMTNLIHENQKISGIEVENQGELRLLKSNFIVLALGHSSRESFAMLYKNNIEMQSKSFAIGVRIEHKREFINQSQYGESYNKNLPTADYKLATTLENGKGVYTFCMCPGGKVVPASSEENQIVVNGMSYFGRNEINSNSAILVTVTPDDFKRETNNLTPLCGIEFQKSLEKKAFEVGGGNYNAPIQLVGDFLKNKKSEKIGSVIPSYEPNTTLSDFREIFPTFIYESLQEGILEMDKKIKNFAMNDAVLTAIESRSSSPITIFRDEFFSTNIRNLMICGEGGGHAGGITSSAIDGLKCAEAIVSILER